MVITGTVACFTVGYCGVLVQLLIVLRIIKKAPNISGGGFLLEAQLSK